MHGAAYRGVYDLADLDRSLFVVTPGQSGNPLSRHARDFLTRWRDGAMVLLGPIPVGVTGTPEARLLRSNIQVRVGDPFHVDDLGLPPGASEQDIADGIMRRVAVLLPYEMRGYYADDGR